MKHVGKLFGLCLSLCAAVICVLGLSITAGAVPAGFTYYPYLAPNCISVGHYAYYVDGAGNYYQVLDYDTDTYVATTFAALTIPSSGHSPVLVEEVPGTCTKAGVKQHYKCLACGGTFLDYSCTKSVSKENLEIPSHVKNIKYVAEVPAKCLESGMRAHYKCTVCGKLYSDSRGEKTATVTSLTITARGHNYVNGVCKKCGSYDPNYLAKIGDIELSNNTYAYDGKGKTPKVTVYDINGNKISDKYYTVTYKNNVNTGENAKVIVTMKKPFKGEYTTYFTIAKAVRDIPDKISTTVDAKVSSMSGGESKVSLNELGKLKGSPKVSISINKKIDGITLKKASGSSYTLKYSFDKSKQKESSYTFTVTIKIGETKNYRAKTVKQTVTVKFK